MPQLAHEPEQPQAGERLGEEEVCAAIQARIVTASEPYASAVQIES